jgi:hypothetical protein
MVFDGILLHFIFVSWTGDASQGPRSSDYPGSFCVLT